MRQQEFDTLLKWLAYPALFKNAIRKSVETGLAFRILTDQTITDELKTQFKVLMQEAIPQADDSFLGLPGAIHPHPMRPLS